MNYQDLIGFSNALALLKFSKRKSFEELELREMIEILFENKIEIYIEVFSALAFPAYKYCRLPLSIEQMDRVITECFGEMATSPKPMHIPKTINYLEKNAETNYEFTSDLENVTRITGFVALLSTESDRDFLRREIKRIEFSESFRFEELENCGFSEIIGGVQHVTTPDGHVWEFASSFSSKALEQMEDNPKSKYFPNPLFPSIYDYKIRQEDILNLIGSEESININQTDITLDEKLVNSDQLKALFSHDNLPDDLYFAFSLFNEAWRDIPPDMKKPTKEQLTSQLTQKGLSIKKTIDAIIKVSTPNNVNLGGKQKSDLKDWAPKDERGKKS
jgi:hypothetical protein